MFSIQVLSAVADARRCDPGKPESCSPAKRNCSSNLATSQSVFPASRNHDRDAVLNLLFARVSDHPGKPGRPHMVQLRPKSSEPASGLPEDMFPRPPPQITAHPGKPEPDCQSIKAAFAALFFNRHPRKLSLPECFCGSLQQLTTCRCFRSRSVSPFPFCDSRQSLASELAFRLILLRLRCGSQTVFLRCISSETDL